MLGKSMMEIELTIRDGPTKMRVHQTKMLNKLMPKKVKHQVKDQLPVEDQELAVVKQPSKPTPDLKLEADQVPQTVDIMQEIMQALVATFSEVQLSLNNNNNNKTLVQLLL
jgi:hypothetical protein